MRSALRRGARTLAGVSGVVAGWQVLGDGWRSAEAAVVAAAASVGPGSVEWAGGDQMWVVGAAEPFVVVVGPWCSSVGPALVALALCAGLGRTGAAARAAVMAVILLVVGNLVRMVTVVMIGARRGAADLELAHDGWAAWLAVGVVLAAAAIVATALRPRSPSAAPPVVSAPCS